MLVLGFQKKITQNQMSSPWTMTACCPLVFTNANINIYKASCLTGKNMRCHITDPSPSWGALANQNLYKWRHPVSPVRTRLSQRRIISIKEIRPKAPSQNSSPLKPTLPGSPLKPQWPNPFPHHRHWTRILFLVGPLHQCHFSLLQLWSWEKNTTPQAPNKCWFKLDPSSKHIQVSKM